jgi:signal transduction histidine kinase
MRVVPSTNGVSPASWIPTGNSRPVRRRRLQRTLAALEQQVGRHHRGGDLGWTRSSATADISERARELICLLRDLRADLVAARRCDARATCCRVLANLRDTFDANGIAKVRLVDTSGATLCRIDTDALQSVLEILIVNAAEAMAASPRRELTVAIASDREAVTIRVSDTGEGLDPADRERVFTREVSTRGSGRGFGLFHARQVVSQFDGTLVVSESQHGRGTTLELCLQPVREDPARALVAPLTQEVQA